MFTDATWQNIIWITFQTVSKPVSYNYPSYLYDWLTRPCMKTHRYFGLLYRFLYCRSTTRGTFCVISLLVQAMLVSNHELSCPTSLQAKTDPGGVKAISVDKPANISCKFNATNRSASFLLLPRG